MSKMDNDAANVKEIDDILKITSQIVAMLIRRKAIDRDELPELAKEIYSLLEQTQFHQINTIRLQPAVPVEFSVMPDYIICLEDGKKLKMLKRHLKTYYGMTPEEYKRRWGLSPDYPVVAPNYAKHRSEIAKSMGLGSRNATDAANRQYWPQLQAFGKDEHKGIEN